MILSHWHSDHISLITQIKENKYGKAFLEKSYWIVPQTASPYGCRLCSMMKNCYVMNHSYPNGERIEMKNIFVGKIDAFPPGLIGEEAKDSDHPHHHGLYAMVRFSNGERCLLAGDCTYSGISERHRKGRDLFYLQASHHGGNYALKPAKPNDLDIPEPGNREGQVVYSANGVTYGHPKAEVVKTHQKRGWNKSFVTAAEWRAEREVEFPS